ncbi:cell division protein ZipA C-terminal FtsZ-binding domain-containing protein [Mucilaginibacter sp. CAU 1740]|uniref:cell division protein ZipA C-terminal FtsZ-binding domain-containing protein n=1 Tax=Mucilaginibacter sp. CAU 1740 TaxID=3140365 RepID=UPI00325BA181
MNKLFLVTVIGIALISSACKQKPKPKGVSTGDGYFISTQSETDQRVKDLGMDKPSENATYILDKRKLLIPPADQPKDGDEYKPDTTQEWVINIGLPASAPPFEKEDLNKIFDAGWSKTYGAATLYGYEADKNRWAFVAGGKEPKKYSKLQLSVNLLQVYDTEPADYVPLKLDAYVGSLRLKLSSYPATVKPTEPSARAVIKARQLVAIKRRFNVDELVILKTDKPYKGMDVWDALQCTGLRWGDGDLFHWNNYKSGYGDEALFSVATDTDPGYFLPEAIKEGRMNPTDLVFGYSIPRSADPEHVFDAMLNAAKYCQKRLGGKMLNQQGQPLNETNEKATITAVVGAMKAKGLVPGSEKVLTIF